MSKVYEVAVQRELNEVYLDALKALEKGRALKIEIKSVATKTKEQLGYYWSVVLPRIQQAMEEDGNELSLVEINQFLNEKFFCNTKTIVWKKGQDEYVHTIRKARSKSGASKDEMSEFLDKVIRWANVDLGIFIPEPVLDISQVPF